MLPKQAEYVESTSRVALYSGGVGAGKTIANVISAIRLAILYPGIDILICAPTYGMLRDTVMREFRERCPTILLDSFTTGIYPEAIFKPNNGRKSTVRFRAFDDIGKPKGITIGAAFVDEVTEMKEGVLQEIRRRLRQKGMPNYLRMSTNPDSKLHYIYQQFVEPAEKQIVPKIKIHYIHTTSFENFMLPPDYLEDLRDMEKTLPAHYMRSVLGEWGDFNEDRIGAFQEIEAFTTGYRVAFIDTSFSDKLKSDRTSVSIVAFSPQQGFDKKYWPIEFTGKSWNRPITDPNVIRDMLLFLDQYLPIETCMESQIGDYSTSRAFIAPFKEQEVQLGLKTKNYWTVFHQTRNKHERIMLNIAGNKDRIRVLKGTDPAYLNMIVNYTKNADHDDEPDSLAGGIHLWQNSEALKAYIRRLMTAGI